MLHARVLRAHAMMIAARALVAALTTGLTDLDAEGPLRVSRRAVTAPRDLGIGHVDRLTLESNRAEILIGAGQIEDALALVHDLDPLAAASVGESTADCQPVVDWRVGVEAERVIADAQRLYGLKRDRPTVRGLHRLKALLRRAGRAAELAPKLRGRFSYARTAPWGAALTLVLFSCTSPPSSSATSPDRLSTSVQRPCPADPLPHARRRPAFVALPEAAGLAGPRRRGRPGRPQGTLVLSTRSTRFTRARLWATVRPGPEALPGSRCSFRSHGASVSSWRRLMRRCCRFFADHAALECRCHLSGLASRGGSGLLAPFQRAEQGSAANAAFTWFAHSLISRALAAPPCARASCHLLQRGK